jgi:Tol biopolymer transport system component
VWSPDARTLAFASGAPFNLFRKDTNGTTPEQRLRESPNLQLPMDWSPDGHSILYTEYKGRQRSIWILPEPPSEAPPRPYLRSGYNEDFPRVSPDGHWLSFESDESGRPEVYVDAFPEPRGRLRVSEGGGQFAEWSSDGRELFYVSPDSMLMAVNMKLGAGDREISSPRLLFPVEIMDGGIAPYLHSPDGKRFLVEESEKLVRPLKVIVNWPGLLK